MTDMEKKIAELKEQGYRKNDTYEVYESASGLQVIQVFTSNWGFEEWRYTMKGEVIDAYQISLYSAPRKIFEKRA